MKSGTNSQKPSFAQLGALAGFIVEFLAGILNFEQVDYWLKNKSKLKKKLCEVFAIMEEYTDLREEWQKFYKEHFNWDVDFSRVIIPPKPSTGSWILLIIAQGMTLNKMFERMEHLFKCWKYADNLDIAVPTNTRTTASHYAVWVLDGIEPDAEFLGKSTLDADPDREIGMTLLERNTLEVRYFSKTGKHLDIKGGTRCSASRDSDGGVPRVSWYPYDGTVIVDSSDVDFTFGRWGIRRAVYS